MVVAKILFPQYINLIGRWQVAIMFVPGSKVLTVGKNSWYSRI